MDDHDLVGEVPGEDVELARNGEGEEDDRASEGGRVRGKEEEREGREGEREAPRVEGGEEARYKGPRGGQGRVAKESCFFAVSGG